MQSTTMDDPDYLTRDEAIKALRIKADTLYAYVSRGLLRRLKDPQSRRSLYLREDVDRLKSRHPGQPVRTAAAARALRWGEPVIDTSISRLDAAGPHYRNRDAIALARSGVSFEAVAHLLLSGIWQPGIDAWPRLETPVDVRRTIATDMKGVTPAELNMAFARVVLSLGMHHRGARELMGDNGDSGRLVIQTLVGCMGYLSPLQKFVARREGEPIAAHLVRACGSPLTEQAVLAVNQVLIILADHELATATFVSRVAASTHNDLFCCIGAALCAHAGSSTAAATWTVEERLFEPLSKRSWADMQKLVRERGTALFGFNHPLYAKGDPRADYILGLIATLTTRSRKVAQLRRFLDEARLSTAAAPGIAVALALLARALDMPRGAAMAIWTISRTAGWIAHAIEQRTQGFMLRPRARYVAR